MKEYLEEYRSYMDQVVVDNTLHHRIMNRITQVTLRRPHPAYRYAAAFAGTAMVVIGVWAAPYLLHRSGEADPPTVQREEVPGVENRHALFFNRAEGALSQAKRYIPGYFTQELTARDMEALFGAGWPTVEKNYKVSAYAGFSGEGVLDEISITCEEKTSGLVTWIRMANGPVGMDYAYPDKVKLSDVNGTTVLAGYYNASSADGKTIYYASFVLGQTGYYLEVSGSEEAKEVLTALVGLIIENGAADLSRITPDSIPEWREDELTLAQAKADPDFGAYVPGDAPAGFGFESSRRILSQSQDKLMITWSSGMKYLEWTVGRLKEEDRTRIVDVNAPETYDLARYPIPRADSVPEELREIVNHPIFRAEDLTLETVRARAYTVNDIGDDNTGYRMRFSVLYGDIVVELNVKGAQPEEIFNMLKGLKNTG